MPYRTRITVNLPTDDDPETLDALGQRAKDRAGEFQPDGTSTKGCAQAIAREW